MYAKNYFFDWSTGSYAYVKWYVWNITETTFNGLANSGVFQAITLFLLEIYLMTPPIQLEKNLHILQNFTKPIAMKSWYKKKPEELPAVFFISDFLDNIHNCPT